MLNEAPRERQRSRYCGFRFHRTPGGLLGVGNRASFAVTFMSGTLPTALDRLYPRLSGLVALIVFGLVALTLPALRRLWLWSRLKRLGT